MTRRRAWKGALTVFGSMAVMASAVVIQVHLAASRTFERNEQICAEKTAALRARGFARPSVYGAAEPGNAWDVYRPVLAALSKMSQAEVALVPEISGEYDEEEPDDELLDLLYEAYAPQIEELKRGVRRERVDPGLDYEHLWKLTGFPVTETFRAERFLTGAMALRYRQGRDAEVLELAVLGLALAQDCARSGPLFQALGRGVCEGLIVDEVRDLLENSTLQARDLERFAGQIDRILSARPDVGENVEVEELQIRSFALHADWSEFVQAGLSSLFSREPIKPSWRLLYSKRLTRAQTLVQIGIWWDELRSVLAATPAERRFAGARLDARLKDFSNPLTEILHPAAEFVFTKEAVVLQKLTLLRVATALAWHEAEKGTMPASLQDLVPRYMGVVPLCPLTGKPLGYSRGKLWSVGVDGGDVVWTVRRAK